MPVPQKFPSDADIQRICKENEYYKLYKCSLFDDERDKRTLFMLQEFFAEDKDKMKVLALAMNLAPAIVRAGSNFLFGQDVKVTIDESSDTDKAIQGAIDRIFRNNELQRKLRESSKPFQYIGHTQFKLRKGKVDGKDTALIDEVPFDNWLPDFTNLPEGHKPKTVYIVSYMSSLDSGAEKKYIYVEEHVAGKITYSLWENIGGKIGDQVSLDTFDGLKPEGTENGFFVEQMTGLSALALLELDAEKDIKDQVGESILKPVTPILHEINMRLTQISLQLLKHLDPILMIPAGSAPKDNNGAAQRKKMEVLEATEGGVTPQYITNDNPMIAEAFDFLAMLVKKAAKLTDTPSSFLEEDEKGGVETAESLRTRFMLFLKRIENYRNAYADGITKMLKLALQIEGVKLPEDIEFKIAFDFGLPKDPSADGRTWGQAVLDGISSVETAVKNFQNLEGDLLDEEIAKIQDDQKRMPPLALPLA